LSFCPKPTWTPTRLTSSFHLSNLSFKLVGSVH
jgi:hypothetical protein